MGSITLAMRSRMGSLPRPRRRSIAASPPPASASSSNSSISANCSSTSSRFWRNASLPAFTAIGSAGASSRGRPPGAKASILTAATLPPPAFRTGPASAGSPCGSRLRCPPRGTDRPGPRPLVSAPVVRAARTLSRNARRGNGHEAQRGIACGHGRGGAVPPDAAGGLRVARRRARLRPGASPSTGGAHRGRDARRSRLRPGRDRSQGHADGGLVAVPGSERRGRNCHARRCPAASGLLPARWQPHREG